MNEQEVVEKLKQLVVHREFNKLLEEMDKKIIELLNLAEEASKITGKIIEVSDEAAIVVAISSILDTFMDRASRKFDPTAVRFAVAWWYRGQYDPVAWVMKMSKLPEVRRIVKEATKELGDPDDGRSSGRH